MNRHIKITPEMNEAFQTTKTSLVKETTAMGICTTSVLVCLFLSSIEIDIPGFKEITSIGAVLCIVIIILAFSKKLKESCNGSDTYLTNCIVPIAKQIDSDIKVSNDNTEIPWLPLAESKFSNKEEAMLDILEYHRVLTKEGCHIMFDTTLDSLSVKDDGFFCSVVKTYYNSGRSYHIDFEGTLIVIKLTKHISDSIDFFTTVQTKNIFGIEKERVSKSGYEMLHKDEVKVDVENIEFNNNFEIYTKNKTTTLNLFTPRVIKALIKLKNQYNTFGGSILNDYLFIGINDVKYLGMPTSTDKAKGLSIETQVADLFKLLDMIFAVRDAVIYKPEN